VNKAKIKTGGRAVYDEDGANVGGRQIYMPGAEDEKINKRDQRRKIRGGRDKKGVWDVGRHRPRERKNIVGNGQQGEEGCLVGEKATHAF